MGRRTVSLRLPPSARRWGVTALATDADVTDTVTYSLTSNPGNFFAIDANTGAW